MSSEAKPVLEITLPDDEEDEDEDENDNEQESEEGETEDESDCGDCGCLPCECTSASVSLDEEEDGSLEKQRDFHRDANNFKKKYGSFGVQIAQPNRGIDEYHVTIYVPITGLLRKTTADAWGIDMSQNVEIIIGVTGNYYSSMKSPQLQLRQNGKPFRLGFQLTGVLQELLNRDNWKTLSDMSRQQQDLVVPTPRPDGTPTYLSLPQFVPGTPLASVVTPSEGASAFPDVSPASFSAENQEKLMGMGYGAKASARALALSDNDVETAVQMLIDNPHLVGVDEGGKPPKKAKKAKKGKSKGFFASLLNTGNTGTDDVAGPSEPASAEADFIYGRGADDMRQYPINWQQGLLVMLADYIRIRLPFLNEHCVICDKGHIFKVGGMLQPAVCSRNLCTYRLQEIGIGADAEVGVAMGAEVIDMLICFVKAGYRGPQRDIRFKPFPSVCEVNSQTPYLNPDRPDYNRLEEILDVFPTTQEIIGVGSFANLRETLEKRHPYAYPLLRWIITSNRAHITCLNQEQRIDEMGTPFQYLMMCFSPEREAIFAEKRKKHGSVFAFHGSAITNWHSILRNGLYNASGTALMSAGAAYGPGIYISPDINVSWGYAQGAYGATTNASEEQFIDSSTAKCIAICEVINDLNTSGNQQIMGLRHGSSNNWQQPDDNCVVTRFLCIFSKNQQPKNMNIQTNKPEFEKKCKAILENLQVL